MSDGELVAWVDDDENLIQVIPRTLANSDPKYLHREIAAIVYDDKRRILLQQRSFTKKVGPGVWTVTVAGHVTYGDSLELTVEKELSEEMGITIPKFIYLFREKVSQSNETHFCHWYIGKYNGGEIVIEPTEVEAYKWVTEQEFANFVATQTVSDRTITMCQRFWAGEWDDLLK